VSTDAGLDIDFDMAPAPDGIITPAADREMATVQGIASGVVQGTVAADPAPSVEFMGKQFRIAEKVGLMPLLKFSAAVDFDISDPRALSAMYAMLRDCIYRGNPGCGSCEHCAPPRCGECRACEIAAGMEEGPGIVLPECQVNIPDATRCKDYDAGDWKAFEDHAIDTQADADELMDVLGKTMEVITGRPTKPPAPSSGGRRGTSAGSTGSSSARRAGGRRR